MTIDFLRVDADEFLPDHLKRGMDEHDPLGSIDQKGVGMRVGMAMQKGCSVRLNLEIGVCGDPASVTFTHRVGLNDVNYSPIVCPSPA